MILCEEYLRIVERALSHVWCTCPINGVGVRGNGEERAWMCRWERQDETREAVCCILRTVTITGKWTARQQQQRPQLQHRNEVNNNDMDLAGGMEGVQMNN